MADEAKTLALIALAKAGRNNPARKKQEMLLTQLYARTETNEAEIDNRFKTFMYGDRYKDKSDIVNPKIGYIFIDENNSSYQYLGGTLGQDGDGWVRVDGHALDIAGKLNSLLTDNITVFYKETFEAVAAADYNDYWVDTNSWVMPNSDPTLSGGVTEAPANTIVINAVSEIGYSYLVSDDRELRLWYTADITATGAFREYDYILDTNLNADGSYDVYRYTNNGTVDVPDLVVNPVIDSVSKAMVTDYTAYIADGTLTYLGNGRINIRYWDSRFSNGIDGIVEAPGTYPAPTVDTDNAALHDYDVWVDLGNSSAAKVLVGTEWRYVVHETYKVYRYADSDGFNDGPLYWRPEHTAIANALSTDYRNRVLAGTAQATADGKIQLLFFDSRYELGVDDGNPAEAGTYTPGNVDEGDLWVDTGSDNAQRVYTLLTANFTDGEDGTIFVYDTDGTTVLGAWVTVSNTFVSTLLLKVSDLEAIRDGNIQIFKEDTKVDVDTAAGTDANGNVQLNYGDYWIDTDSWADGTHEYYTVWRWQMFDGSSVASGSTNSVVRPDTETAADVVDDTLNWYKSSSDMAVSLAAAHRADILVGIEVKERTVVWYWDSRYADGTGDNGAIAAAIGTYLPESNTANEVTDGDLWVDLGNNNVTKVRQNSAWIDMTNLLSDRLARRSSTYIGEFDSNSIPDQAYLDGLPNTDDLYGYMLKNGDSYYNTTSGTLYQWKNGVWSVPSVSVLSVYGPSVFKYAAGATTANPATMTLVVSGDAGGQWAENSSGSFVDIAVETSQTLVVDSTATYWDSVDTITFRYTLNGISDSHTVTKLYDALDGAAGITIAQSNEACTMTADADGVVASYLGTATAFTVYEGTTALSYNTDGSAGSWQVASVTPSDTHIVVGTNTNGNFDDISAFPAYVDSGYIDYNVVVYPSYGGTLSMISRQTLSKARQGVQGEQGIQGPQGDQGIQGPIGPDGVAQYFHVAYADSSDGSVNFNQSGGKYVGTYVDTNETDSTIYTDYVWRVFQGPEGIQGPTGADGQTSYLHIKYSDDGGSTFTANSGEDVGSYIGTYVDFTEADSAAIATYTWARFKGDTGVSIVWKGESATAPTAPEENWTYKNTTDGITYIYSSGAWGMMVQDGNEGPQGSKGDNGFSVYIIYNDSAVTSAPSKPTSVDGTDNGWHTDATGAVNWMSQKVDDGTTAGWSSPIAVTGVDGLDGQGIVKGVAFNRSASAPVAATGGDFGSPNPTNTTDGWSDGIPSGSDPLWMTTRVFTSDGLAPQETAWKGAQLVSALGDGIRVTFSVDGINWHDTAAETDIWMRTYKTVNGVESVQGTVKIKGEQGDTGASIDVVFQKSETIPATITATDGTHTGWETNIGNVTGTGYVWSSIGRNDGYGNWTWQAPIRQDGEVVAEVYVYSKVNGTPSGGSYDMGNKTLTAPTDWSITPPALANGETSYVSAGTASGAQDSIVIPAWTAGVVYAVRNDGVNGVSVDSVEERYAVGGDTEPADKSSWGTTIVSTTADNPKLWRYTHVVKSDGTVYDTTAVVIGMYTEDGISVTGTNSAYQKSTSGSTVPTGTWYADITDSNVQLTDTDKYLWLRENTVFSNGVVGDPIYKVIAVKGDQGVHGTSADIVFQRNAVQPANITSTDSVPSGWFTNVADATGDGFVWASTGKSTDGGVTWNWGVPTRQDGEVVTEVYVYKIDTASSTPTGGSYNLTTKALSVPSGWSSTPPALVDGETSYVSAGLVNSYAGDTAASVIWSGSTVYAVRNDGIQGISITAVINYYAVNNSSSSAPTSWSTTLQSTTSSNRYLWTYTKTFFSDGSVDTSTAQVIGMYTEDGAPGKGISSISAEYQRDSDSSSAPTGTWSSSIGDVALTDTYKYLWERETISYTDGTSSYITKVIAVKGTDGAPGVNGADGTNGIDGDRGAGLFPASGVWDGTTSSASNATNAVTTLPLVVGDLVSFELGDTPAVRWTGSAWEAQAAFINGNAVVNGTLTVGSFAEPGEVMPNHNLVYNGSFENGLDGWTRDTVNAVDTTKFQQQVDNVFGSCVTGTASGTFVMYSAEFVAAPSKTYTISSDILYNTSSGQGYIDVFWYDSNHNELGETGQVSITNQPSFHDDFSYRKAHKYTVTSHSSAAYGRARVVVSGKDDSAIYGFRQIKVELGDQCTAYSSNSNVTTIDGSKITTGTIVADRILLDGVYLNDDGGGKVSIPNNSITRTYTGSVHYTDIGDADIVAINSVSTTATSKVSVMASGTFNPGHHGDSGDYGTVEVLYGSTLLGGNTSYNDGATVSVTGSVNPGVTATDVVVRFIDGATGDVRILIIITER